MKSFIVLAVLVAAVAAGPVNPDADAQIVKQAFDNIGVDGFAYEVETSNGIKQQEQGQLKNAGTDNEALEVRGEYQYTGDDGVVYRVVYVSNELGFQPSGAHIPQARR